VKVKIYYRPELNRWFAREHSFWGDSDIFGSGYTEQEAVDNLKKRLKEEPKPTFSNPKIIKIDV